MMSFSAKLTEKMIKLIDFKGVRKKESTPFVRNNTHATPPKFIAKKYDITNHVVLTRNCYTIKTVRHAKTHIIFLHGGAYRNQATILHWLFMDKLIKHLKCDLTFIDYPMAPESHCQDATQMVCAAYKKLFGKKTTQRVVLMGDSAGAGLALVSAQIIQSENISPKPDKLVLLSPWLDISMESDIPQQTQDSDLMLDVQNLKTWGKEYAGALDVKNPLCSPMFGDLKGLCAIALFVGTHDVLSVDARKFKTLAKEDVKDIGLVLIP